MKIVNIEDFFHPDAGYQINILPKYLAKMGHEVTIITSEMKKIPDDLTSFFGRDNITQRDEKYTKENNVKIVRLPLKAFISGRAVFSSKLFKVVQEESPDIVYVHGNDTLTGMRFLKRCNSLKYALVMDSHMLEMASVNKFSRLFKKFYKSHYTPVIVKNKITVIRTQDDPYVEKCLGIPLSQAPWISYGSDTLLFHPDKEAKKAFRAECGISQNAFAVVYAGKLDEAKGGQFFADAILKKITAEKEIVFVVVGNASGDYGKKVEETFSQSENKIVRFPTQKYSDLAKYFQIADLVVFPKQCSLSFYDAQACAVPVLSEDNNINVGRCSHENGWNFKSGDKEDFRTKIEAAADMEERDYQIISDNAYKFIINNYNYADKAKEYENILCEEYRKFKVKGI